MVRTRFLAALAIAGGIALAAIPAQSRTDPSAFSIGELAAIDLVNGYLNDIRTLQGDFVQVAPDGQETTGKFFIERPGKLRFEYAPPAQLRLISDGTWVAIQDRKAKTSEKYLLRTTPMRLILKDQLDLMNEAQVLEVETGGELIEITVEDSGGNSAGGTLTLFFDPVTNQLRRWIVTDAQGLQTTVTLQNAVAGQPIDKGIFRIVEQRILDNDFGR